MTDTHTVTCPTRILQHFNKETVAQHWMSHTDCCEKVCIDQCRAMHQSFSMHWIAPRGEILPEPKGRSIAHSLSCSPFHRLEMTKILLKGLKTLTYPSIHPCTARICAPHCWRVFGENSAKQILLNSRLMNVKITHKSFVHEIKSPALFWYCGIGSFFCY